MGYSLGMRTRIEALEPRVLLSYPFDRAFRTSIALSIAALIVGLLLVIRLFHLIDAYCVDVMFLDHWDLYRGVFDGSASWWDLFRWQHGPHRQGAGFWIMRLVDELTGWNVKSQAIMIGAVICLAAGLSLLLKRRLYGHLAWHDVAIPMLLLTRGQWEIYVCTPNISHGALPLLLIVLLGLAWTIRQPWVRYTLIGILTFLATHTGFGLFVGLVVPGILLIEGIVLWRNRELVRAHGDARAEVMGWSFALAACAASLGSFFHGYVFAPAVEGFVFPAPQPWQYLQYVALEFASFLGARGSGLAVQIYGGGLILCMLLLCLWCARGILLQGKNRSTPNPLYPVILLLLGFSLAFAFNSAIGRLCIGLSSAKASRYLPLLMPAGLGLYLAILHIRRPWMLHAGIAGFLILSSIVAMRTQSKGAARFYEAKTRWIATYRQTHSIAEADRDAGMPLHPVPEQVQLQDRLNQLEQRHLSFFREPQADEERIPSKRQRP